MLCISISRNTQQCINTWPTRLACSACRWVTAELIYQKAHNPSTQHSQSLLLLTPIPPARIPQLSCLVLKQYAKHCKQVKISPKLLRNKLKGASAEQLRTVKAQIWIKEASRGGPSIGHGRAHVHPIIFAKTSKFSRQNTWSDPSTDSIHRGLGVRFRAAGRKGKGLGGHTSLMLVGVESPDEDLAKGGRSPCRRRLAARKENPGGGMKRRKEKQRALGAILGKHSVRQGLGCKLSFFFFFFFFWTGKLLFSFCYIYWATCKVRMFSFLLFLDKNLNMVPYYIWNRIYC